MKRYGICKKLLLIVTISCLIFLAGIYTASDDNLQQKKIDYSKYLNKTWVTENELGDVGSAHASSFFITKAEDGLIEGEFTGMVAERRMSPRSQYDKFSGSIHDDIADCIFVSSPVLDYYDGSEFCGKLYFREDNRILAHFEFPPNEFIYNGYYLYRPYNIADIGFQDEFKRKEVFPLELEYGEEVSILVAMLSGERLEDSALSPYTNSFIYLINENEDILYFFDIPNPLNTEVTSVMAEDMNGDGLKDIRLTTTFTDGSKQEEWQIYQTEYGKFYYSGEV